MLDYHIKQSVISMHHLRTRFDEGPPRYYSIRKWYMGFKRDCFICKEKSTERSPVSNEVVQKVRESFTRSPQKSTLHAAENLANHSQQFGKFYAKV